MIKRMFPCANDNDRNEKKREHMALVSFYLAHKDEIYRLWDSWNDDEKAVWLNP